MPEEKRGRVVIPPESPQSRGGQPPIIPRGRWRSQDEIDALADKVAENQSLMQFINSTLDLRDEELTKLAVEKVREEIGQTDLAPIYSDAARVLVRLAARAHGIKGGGR
jgi:hypothetical protein